MGLSRHLPTARLPPLLALTLLGSTTGLPLILAGGTLQAWMKSDGVSLEWIGLFALTGAPYLLKCVWSPMLDRFRPPFGGRRRGWILIMILAIMVSLLLMAQCHPAVRLWPLAILAFGLAFFGASADINIDALRVEVLSPRWVGLGTTLHFTGLRVSMLLVSALTLWLSDRISWQRVYLLMILGLVPGAVAALLGPEPGGMGPSPTTLREAAVGPFVDFFKRKASFQLLSFILLFKLGDSLATALNIPFLMDIGFTRSEIAVATNTVGLVALLAGGCLGGWIMHRTRLQWVLWLLGGLQLAAIITLAWLAHGGKSQILLWSVIALDNSLFSTGMVALLALIQRLCDPGRAATQFAFLSSLTALPRVLFATPVGLLAHGLGWSGFFVFCACLAVPGLLLLLRFRTWDLPEA